MGLLLFYLTHFDGQVGAAVLTKKAARAFFRVTDYDSLLFIPGKNFLRAESQTNAAVLAPLGIDFDMKGPSHDFSLRFVPRSATGVVAARALPLLAVIWF
jgi:hypothetical protein